MFVYDNNDIVSNQLRGTQHTWEAGEINEMLWALRQSKSVQQLLVSQGKPPGPAAPLMVDIGANIGWWVVRLAVQIKGVSPGCAQDGRCHWHLNMCGWCLHWGAVDAILTG